MQRTAKYYKGLLQITENKENVLHSITTYYLELESTGAQCPAK